MNKVAETTQHLTDEQVTAFIDDPATIPDHEAALEVMGILDAEISNIQAQIDAASIEAQAHALSDERQDWLRRAAYALSMRKREWHLVYRRDKELRAVKGPAQLSPQRAEEKRLKQERLLLEAQNRKELNKQGREALQLQKERLAMERSNYRRFVEIAKQKLPQDVLAEIWDEVKRND